MNADEHQNRSPWHLWVIGIFFLFLYGIGAYDYFMVLGLNEAYYNYNNFGEEVYEYFMNYPLLPLIFWTANIISGITSSILLLFRLNWVVQASFISAISIILLQLITFGYMDRWNVLGSRLSFFDMVIMLITLGFFFYCVVIARRGVLR
jgi:hypothetical protein